MNLTICWVVEIFKLSLFSFASLKYLTEQKHKASAREERQVRNSLIAPFPIVIHVLVYHNAWSL